MGTEVPEYAKNVTFELENITFIDQYKDSVTTIALQLAILLTDQDIYLVGYDDIRGMYFLKKKWH